VAIDKNGDEVRASESKKPIGSINVIENLFLIQGILAGEYEAKENKSLVEIFASACHEIFKVVGEDAVNSETKVTLVRTLRTFLQNLLQPLPLFSRKEQDEPHR
jgi:hypothetical protein